MDNLNFSGLQALRNAIQMQPKLQLSFYDFGVMMRRVTEGGGCMEYPVDPAQIAAAMATKTRWYTGILNPNTICILAEGVQRAVVEYRPPQKTAIFLEGSEVPLKVPLPGLLLIRLTESGDHPKYMIFAAKERPTSLKAKLFQPPLPNIYAQGAICWGSVKKVSASALAGSDLAEDWKMFLGSPFNGHSVDGKSHSHKKDIRLKLAELETQKVREYPLDDLVGMNQTLGKVLKGED